MTDKENHVNTYLNDRDLDLLKNKELFLLKRSLADKLNLMLGDCIEPLRLQLPDFENILPEEFLNSNAKITKGENYLGFPWTILDYPRVFNKHAIMALRTFCWWGNNFSITLHLSGVYEEKFRDKLFSKWEQLKESDLLICINENPWLHHQNQDNYLRIKDSNQSSSFYKDAAQKSGFIKLTRVIALDNYALIPLICSETAKLYFSLLAD